MSVLIDMDILSELEAGRLSIEPFREKNLTPNGYDVTIDEIYIPAMDSRHTEGKADIPPGLWFAVSSREYFRIPSDVIGQLWLRSSHVRKGILSSFGRVDAGFQGNLTFGGFNASHETATLDIGDTYAQLVLERLTGEVGKDYGRRSGNYQGQRGLTLEKLK